MAKKIKVDPLAAILGTGADEFLHGDNDFLNPDTMDGAGGNDTLESHMGNDTLIGGAGDDTFLFNWDDSNIGLGKDTVVDFNSTTELDKIDLSHNTHLSDPDLNIAVARPVDAGDVTFTAIAGGTHMHVEIVAGDPTWDIDVDFMDVLGVAPPTLADIIFA